MPNVEGVYSSLQIEHLVNNLPGEQRFNWYFLHKNNDDDAGDAVGTLCSSWWLCVTAATGENLWIAISQQYHPVSAVI